MKRSAPKHPKMFALAAALNIPRPFAVGIMELLWQFTATERPQGDIGRLPDDEIAKACGWKKKPETLIAALCDKDVKFLEHDDTYRLIVHDWPEHCEQSVKKWLERNGKDFLSVYSQKSGQNLSNGYPKDSQHPPSREAAAGAGAGAGAEASEEIKKIPFDSRRISESWDDHQFRVDFKGIWVRSECATSIGSGSQIAVDMCLQHPNPQYLASSFLESAALWIDHYQQRGISRRVDEWIRSGDWEQSPPKARSATKPIQQSKSEGLIAAVIAKQKTEAV